jgi:hypothetical protein
MKGESMTPNPWYREPWPWFIMAGPAIVVVAGISTAVIAVRSFDGMVADDYYKQGLAINRVIAREAAARRMGVAASVAFGAGKTRVRVVMGDGARPASLTLALVHPTLPREDQSVVLAMTAPGVYEARLRAPSGRRYALRLEDGEGRWRLAGQWSTANDSVQLTP